MSRFPSGTRFNVDISPNKTVANNTPTSITLHWWDDPAKKPSFGGVVSWLKNPRARVSAHYVVEANRITQMVLEKDTAWHSGSNNGNRFSVGIEVNPRLNAGDYETAAQLVAEIWSRLGKLPVYPHRHWSSTSCPGTMDLNRVIRRAEQIRSGTSGSSGGSSSTPASKPKPAPAPKPKPSPAPSKLTVDGRCGRLTISALQRVLKVTVDGRAGAQTFTALQRHLSAPFVDGKISRQSYRATELGNGIVPSAWEFTGRGSSGSQTVQALQRRVGVTADGIWFEGTTRALQRALNNGNF